MTVADRIRELRESKQWTQDDLARACGYKYRSSISTIESSGDDITSKKIKKIANALGCSVAYLMGWEGPDDRDFFDKLEDADYLADVVFDFKALEYSKKLSKLTKEQRENVYQYIDFLSSRN